MCLLCVNEYMSNFLSVRIGGNFGLSFSQIIIANPHHIHSSPDWGQFGYRELLYGKPVF